MWSSNDMKLVYHPAKGFWSCSHDYFLKFLVKHGWSVVSAANANQS